MIATIRKWGNSQGLRLSKELLSGLGIGIDDKVNIDIIDEKIVIYKVEEDELKLSDVFAEYKGKEETEEINWGKPEGKEVW
ncbi:MAG: AbrB/MazE/SpoVT family DNA-binding domain-containing protein [Clostridiales bacterium]|nr:AbrB/MazE/SpoVT family DNA-binding domain-containing protein [Clostridiales bacterium]